MVCLLRIIVEFASVCSQLVTASLHAILEHTHTQQTEDLLHSFSLILIEHIADGAAAIWWDLHRHRTENRDRFKERLMALVLHTSVVCLAGGRGLMQFYRIGAPTLV